MPQASSRTSRYPNRETEAGVAGSGLPLRRVIHLAAFRAALRDFLHQTELVARNWDLTPQRYLLLLAIQGAPDGSARLSFSEVAERMRLSRNTVTELCARAEEAGLIEREPSKDDARVVYLKLTAEGERRLTGAIREMESDRTALIDAFDDLAETFRVAARRRR